MSEPWQLAISDLDPFDDAEFDEFHAVYDAAADARPRGDRHAVGARRSCAPPMQEDTQRSSGTGSSAASTAQSSRPASSRAPSLDNLEIGRASVNVLPRPPPPGLRHRDAGAAASRSPGSAAGPPSLAMRRLALRRAPRGRRRRRRRVRAGTTATRWRSSRSSAGSTCRSPRRPSDRLAAAAAEHHAGYTLRSWSGPGPRGPAPGLGRGRPSALMTEAPTGEIDREPEVAGTAASVREGRGDLPCEQGRRSSTPPRPSTPRARSSRTPTSASTPRARAARLPVGHPGPRRAPRPPARAGGQGRQPPAAPGRAARTCGQVVHLERRGQRPHDRRQRGDGLRPRRALGRSLQKHLPEGRLSRASLIVLVVALPRRSRRTSLCPAMDRWLVVQVDTSASTRHRTRAPWARPVGRAVSGRRPSNPLDGLSR